MYVIVKPKSVLSISGQESRWKSPEFLLIFILLIFMWIALIPIMFMSFPIQGSTADLTAETILGFRRDMFTAVLTAFAAWIGAGSAYFFGRENLREAITAIKGVTPRELLERKRLSEVMRHLGPTVQEEDTVSDAMKKVFDDPENWFVPVVDQQGRLMTVIHEESIQRYLAEKMKTEERPAMELYSELMSTSIKDIINYIEENFRGTDKLKKLIDIHVPMDIDSSCILAQERMDSAEKTLTVIVDSSGVPKGYLTTGDIRRVLLKD